MAPNKASSKLEEVVPREATLIVAPWDQCKSLRVLVAAHKLDTKIALVCNDLKQKPADSTLPFERRWVNLQQGNWKQVIAVPLTKELPNWGVQPLISDCSKNKPEQEDLATIRVTLAKEYMTDADWQQALRKPAGLMMSLMPGGLSVRSYGWHAVPSDLPSCLLSS